MVHRNSEYEADEQAELSAEPVTVQQIDIWIAENERALDALEQQAEVICEATSRLRALRDEYLAALARSDAQPLDSASTAGRTVSTADLDAEDQHGRHAG